MTTTDRPGSATAEQLLHTVLTQVGRELAVTTRQRQGLTPHVEDAAAIDGFVELWQRPA